jgi:hypothetical protein
MSLRYVVSPHIPHGSGDAEYRILAMPSRIPVAVIDPEMVLDDPSEVADRICALLNGLDVDIRRRDAKP